MIAAVETHANKNGFWAFRPAKLAHYLQNQIMMIILLFGNLSSTSKSRDPNLFKEDPKVFQTPCMLEAGAKNMLQSCALSGWRSPPADFPEGPPLPLFDKKKQLRAKR